ncbi:Wobble nucleotide-excising tRNase [Pilibacter termitis]|uniref:Wobble nucleotide-excising tRNase n=1 Tax=Pilibacter termitis TaxID=263852 RepID=A0A1T4PRZ5_9ENTE|nr:AAA family ATPase [Pilibacter termitis]SJZ94332.1 Wobble nucleotide-excising tRNase [Pilibacter termitis]
MQKIPAPIAEITLNEATFHNEFFQPTLINYLYGKNGVGKSTIGRVIKSDSGLIWNSNHTMTDFSILVYNEDFIKRNFSSYDNLAGVFTIGEDDISVREEIEAKSAERQLLLNQHKSIKESIQKKTDERNSIEQAFKRAVFESSADFRNYFIDAMQGKRGKPDVFVPELLKQTNAVKHDLNELKMLYDTAFDKSSVAYPELRKVDKSLLSTSPLLEKSIVSSSNSTFAEFVKRYQTSDWVRHGHDHFKNTDGHCPYCQQVLPNNFEEQISSIFDDQYQSDLNAVKSFKQSYKHNLSSLIDTLNTNTSTMYSKLNLTEYLDKLELLKSVANENLKTIEDKLNEPSSIVKLRDTDSIIDEINGLIADFNQQIKTNNDIVAGKNDKKKECIKQLWELIYDTLKPQVDAYHTNVATFDDEIATLNQQLSDIVTQGKDVSAKLAELNKQSINTTDAIDSMNILLSDSGFQGFSIRSKDGENNVYEVIRQDGRVAENLSEGERNFIAFLYFYHLVHGSPTDDGTNRDKIVVIDDPVSSMDSGALFIVSALVRGMVGICRNNASLNKQNNISQENYIKQIFVLTHNTYFHNEVTSNMDRYWDSVSFFLISKLDNHSHVKLCYREENDLQGNPKHYNVDPVQNGYHALWTELKDLSRLQNVSPVSVTHVIHQILDHYFIQMCCYDGNSIRDRILVDNKQKFQKLDDEGNEIIDERYYLIQSMLSYLATTKNTISDAHFIDEAMDPQTCLRVFKEIFEIMEQNQHYTMMMGGTL